MDNNKDLGIMEIVEITVVNAFHLLRSIWLEEWLMLLEILWLSISIPPLEIINAWL